MHQVASTVRLFMVSALLLAAACDSGGGGEGPTADVAAGVDARALDDAVAGPDAAGADASAPDTVVARPFEAPLAASFQALLDEHVAFSADPGVALTVRMDDGREWSGAAGVAELRDRTPMVPEQGFRVGSNTKPFTATLVLQLVDEGLVELDAPLATYLPALTVWAEVTVRELLDMHSGIKDYITDGPCMLAVIQDPTKVRAPEELLAFVEDDPLALGPGGEGIYTNSSYVLLGMVVEAVTGRPFDEELRTRILEPLELADTFLDTTGEVRDGVARGYMDLTIVGELFGVPPSVLAFVPEENRWQGAIVDCSYLFHPSLTWAAGALVSTTEDMTTFVRGLLGGALVSAATLEEMTVTKPVMILGEPVPYGLGLQIRPTAWGTAYGHGGLNFGYQAGTYYVPDLGVTFSHMHNYLPEQSDHFQSELLGLVAEPPTEARLACVAPDDLFASGEDGAYLHLRFKGVVNAAGASPNVAGIANAIQVQAGEDVVPLYGWGAESHRKLQGGTTRLEVVTYGPTNTPEAPVRATTVSFDPAVFTQLDADGRYTATLANAGAALVTVADVTMETVTSPPTKLCFIAVTDFSRPSRFEVCAPDDRTGDEGEVLKIFGSFALETDPAKVAQTLATIGMTPCLCPDATGAWAACAD